MIKPKKGWNMRSLIRGYNVLIFLVILGVIAYINSVAIQQIRSTEQSREQAVLDSWMRQMEKNLENNTIFANNLVCDNIHLVELENGDTDAEKYYVIVEIYSEIKDYALLNYGMNEMFFYSKKGGNNQYLSTNRSGLSSHNQVNDKILEMIELCHENNTSGKWQFVELEGINYLIYIVENNGYYAGCYATTEYLLDLFTDSNDESKKLFITDKDGYVYTDGYLEETAVDFEQMEYKGDDEVYRQYISCSSMVGLGLGEHIEKGAAEKALTHIQAIMIMLSIILSAVILGMSGLLNRLLYQPIRKLVAKMAVVSDGNFEEIDESGENLREIEILNHAFNRMVTEIKKLKIDIYEEKLREQEVRLLYLQLQIRPHFVVNVLNNIYSMAEMNRTDGIQKICLYLMKYLRFLYNKKQQLILLSEEMECVNAYVEIQKMRLQNQFKFEMEVEPSCTMELIPPLLIQTFVENSMKYGIRLETENNDIQVEIKRELKDIVITVCDCGPGYPQDVLEAVANGKRTENRDSGVGIFNLCSRLQLLYGEKATVSLYNDSGACSVVRFPCFENRIE